MAQWKIRVAVPDGPDGHQALAAALAGVPAAALQLAPADPSGAGVTHRTGDVVIELSEERSLPDLLHALHELSPQVFISRVPQSGADPGMAAADRKVRVRKLRGALFVVS